MGLALGDDAIPRSWKDPLDDRLDTVLSSYSHVRLSDLANETASLIDGFQI
jgi:hypothetical protein